MTKQKTLLRENAESIKEAMEEEYLEQFESNEYNIHDIIFEEVDSYCVYTSDCWKMANESKKENVTASEVYYQNKDNIDDIIIGYAFGCLERMVYQLIREDNNSQLQKFI